MDFFATFITIVDGRMTDAVRELSQIFGLGSGEGRRGQRRWAIIQNEAGWYLPLASKPKVAVAAFDFEVEKIKKYLKEKGIAA